MNKGEIFRAIETERGALMRLIDPGPTGRSTNARVSGNWTRKDLLAHIALWERICAHYLEELNKNRPIPMLEQTTDEMNAQNYLAKKDLPLADIREEAAASYQALLEQLDLLDDSRLAEGIRGPWPEGRVEGTLAKIIAGDTWEHYQEHLRDLKKT